MPVVLKVLETRSRMLREEFGLRMLEDRLLGRLFGLNEE
jgi:hypothetical protein